MKKSSKILIFEIGFLILALGLISSINFTSFNLDAKNNEMMVSNNNLQPEISWFNNTQAPIFINGSATGVGGLNWTWARSQPFCQKGDGSWGNPYIIENISIDCGNSGSGILINDSKTVYFIIQNCTITGSGSLSYDAGIKLQNTCNGTIFNNTCSQNGASGIVLYDHCENNTIEKNIVNYNAASGVYVRINCLKNRFNNNIAKNNDYYGIYISLTSDSNNITNNICSNQNRGIYIDGGSGGCDANIIENNTCNNNIERGIDVYANCWNNEIIKNTITNSSWGCSVNWNSDGTVVKNNTISCTDGIYLGYLSNSVDIYNNTMFGGGIHKYGRDESLANMLTIDIKDNTINGKPVYTYKSESGLDTNNFTKYGNPGQIILMGCSNSNISHFNFSDITCPIAIYYSNNITIYKNTIDNAYHGIYAAASDFNNITENTINNCRYIGIYLSAASSGSDNNTISKNAVNNNVIGIYIYYGCNNNTLYNNVANDNGNIGIYLDGNNDKNTIMSNTLISNTNYGMRFEATSGNNTIIGNIIRNNGVNNIFDQAPDNNFMWNVLDWTLTHPIIIDETGAGNFTWSEAESSLVWVTGSGISSNPYLIKDFKLDLVGTGSGFYIKNSDAYFLINNCTVYHAGSGNWDAGIYLDSVSNGTVFNCNISNNGAYGILFWPNCDNNTIEGNTVSFNQGFAGIYCEGPSDDFNTYKGNKVYNNSQYGIFLWGISNNIISENQVYNNHDNGINLQLSTATTVQSNNVYNNIGTGIQIELDSIDNDIISNTITGNIIGINLFQNCDNNTFWDNQILNNINLGVRIQNWAPNDCQDNVFYSNSFNNPLGTNAEDNCIGNYWYLGTTGNWWHDYSGRDADDNGRGDTPYTISGSAGAQDKYPIWSDGCDINCEEEPEAPSNYTLTIIIIVIIIGGVVGSIGVLYWKKPEEVKGAIQKLKDRLKRQR